MTDSNAATQTSPVRWGIAGPGRIAHNLAPDFEFVAGAELTAVASRSPERAAAFAAAHGVARSYGSYAELMADDEIDAVYIATPHPQHAAIALAAIEAGKAVLVEKAFTATAAGARQVVAAARHHGVFAMEAMWTRFQPTVRRAVELIADGAIGEVASVQADLGVTRVFDPSDRIFARELGGGALLDLGVYVASFAQQFLGTPDRVSVEASLEPSGVDAAASLLFGYDNGRVATLMCSLHSPLPGHARIFGSTGWIDVEPRFHHPQSLILHREGADPERFTDSPLGRGYAEELLEVTRRVVAGDTESTIMPLEDTLAVMDILDGALRDIGVEFNEDETAMHS